MGERLGGQGLDGADEVVERVLPAVQGRRGGLGELGPDSVAEPRLGGGGLQERRVAEMPAAAGGQ
ncbi:hypothetical protein [Streptomyces sp. GESEQ-35]|uniref:hypothetical protein n=1 Tax=Streptomyces sp. GESEQ-35 TaxID=2812657 RepID=UPI001B31EBF0|nr:hypothetical protein [Streptomyces sp. GESEQ-35]